MSIFGMTSVIGIALGPFVGGAAQTHLNWRWIYWVSALALSFASKELPANADIPGFVNRYSLFLTLLCSRFSGSS
jgi:MFS family permease